MTQFRLPNAIVLASLSFCVTSTAKAQPKMQFGFLWHMHQPIYYPYESVIATQSNNRYTFNVLDVHNQRFGPYTTWPRDAVQSGASFAHLGAQVSFTGSLIENLNALEAAGINGGMWTSWKTGYNNGLLLNTALNKPRLDLVAFGYFHPLMPLLDTQDIRMQIKLHKHIYAQTWTNRPTYSHGIFPPETAFSERIIPALVAEGIDWALIDNIHFDRACVNYPHTNASCIYSPNKADQLNPDPAASGGAWVQLNNLWAPSRVSVPFGYQPHQVQHIDPATGAISKMIAIPAARYEGNEDGRGGYGALLYSTVMNQYIAYNTNSNHPMYVVLHHDGDNYGGGTDAYYHSNFQNMLAWLGSDPNYECTTVEDYLARFPVPAADVIHVESGSWAGADCGDPEFKKWLGDPNASGWSPDQNSWAVLTAAKNRVFMADAVAPYASLQNVLNGKGTNTEKAWHFLLAAEASDYWYWDGSSEPWDSNVTRACNQAVTFANAAIAAQPDTTPPTVFLPQRNPYNPGGFEWGATPEPSDFQVWTYAYDVSGLTTVTLKWRRDLDGQNPITSTQNETYAGGPEVESWNTVPMAVIPDPTVPANILAATYRAARYAAMITGENNKLIDYYVEATDTLGNIFRTDIQHVWVGQNTTGGGGGDVVTIAPNPPQAGQNVLIQYNPAGRPLAGAGAVNIHYGFNQWNPVISPDPAMTWNASTSRWETTVAVASTANQLDMVFNNGAGTWDNNAGADWHFAVQGGAAAPTWTMDGALDADATLAGANGSMFLRAGVKASVLYLAAPNPANNNDHFLYVAGPPGALRAAQWAKAGQVANWKSFVGAEVSNNYSGWSDLPAATAAQSTRGAVLEATIDLAAAFGGTIPDSIYLAFAPFANPDGGALVSANQVPPCLACNGNLEANEYLSFQTFRRGDLNADWRIDAADIPLIAPVLLGIDNNAYHVRAADMNADAASDGRDIQLFVASLTGD